MKSSIIKDAAELCDMQTTECHTNDVTTTCCGESIEHSDCCLDSSEFIEGISIEERARSEQRVDLQPVIVQISTFLINNPILNENRYTVFHDSTPLFLSVDVGILFQVFRI